MTRCGRCRRCECAGAPTTTSHGDVRNRDNDAPDAVLEGLAMTGLVDILRQLGDLAELAAEVFDDMQDQVMAASARGRRLAARARKLLAADLDLVLDLDLPPPSTQEHRCLSSAAAAALATSGSAGRLGCRSHLGGAPPMPRVVVQRIERCRGPPRLSLLDKFDAAGEGACLKRYTDPSFFFRAHSAKIDEQGMLKQHRRQAAAAAGAFLLMQQTAAHRVEPSPQQPNMEQKLQEGSTTQPSPSELERTSSFEAWLSPQARGFPTATATHHHLQEPPDDDGGGGGGATTCSGSISSQVVTTSNAAAVSSSSTVKAIRLNSASEVKGGESNTTRSRYKGKIASRVSSLPRKLFMNTTKHHNDRSRSYRAGSSSLRVTQANCSPELEATAIAIPNPAADSKNLLLLLPGSGPVLEPPDNSSAAAAEDAKSSKLKPASRASSHVTGTGSPTNATILNRADGIRQVHDDETDQIWSDDTQ
ncbi:SCAR-like protein 1 [Zea mays]|uniref:Protein SCAR n=1 Tax=Zea mays TaxID=4577 RepID=A0A3L6DYQ9_MAIZE|nr:SCAR-like protein 1 [Zea mays]